MNRGKLFCAVLAIAITYSASAQDYYTYDSYEEQSERYFRPEGFRLDVSAGLSMLLFDFEHPRIKLNKFGPQVNVTPTYVFSSENHALGLDCIWKHHEYDHDLLMDKVDLNIFYFGPKYTWEATPHKKSSVFIDIALYYGRVNEVGRNNSVDNNFETWGIAGSVGYDFKMTGWAKVFVKATWMYSSYEVSGGVYTGRDLSALSLTTGFWLFK